MKLKIVTGLLVAGLLVVGCKKDEVNPSATLTTNAVRDISTTTAVAGSNVVTACGGTVIERGVCWSVNHNPTVADNKTSDGTGTGNFFSNITGLVSGTSYYLRAYATINGGKTFYSSEVSFSTP